MKRLSITMAVGVAASAGLVLPAVAAPPEPLPGEPFIVEVCDFPLEAAVRGKVKVIEHADRIISVALGQKVTLTNVETGKSKRFVITGSFHEVAGPDGSSVNMAVGKNVLSGPGIEGLLLTTGRVIVTTTNPDNPEISTQTINSSHGKIVNLCDVLA